MLRLTQVASLCYTVHRRICSQKKFTIPLVLSFLQQGHCRLTRAVWETYHEFLTNTSYTFCLELIVVFIYLSSLSARFKRWSTRIISLWYTGWFPTYGLTRGAQRKKLFPAIRCFRYSGETKRIQTKEILLFTILPLSLAIMLNFLSVNKFLRHEICHVTESESRCQCSILSGFKKCICVLKTS